VLADKYLTGVLSKSSSLKVNNHAVDVLKPEPMRLALGCRDSQNQKQGQPFN